MAETKHLIIVESPAKAKTIGKYLGPGYRVRASVGHIRDLPERELGVDIEQGFEPRYVTIRGKGKIIMELRRDASGVDDVILATDPDREGEAIAWHVAEQLGYDGTNGDGDGRFRRVLFHEITRDAVRHALEHPLKLDMRKVEAQQARRILDRLVGYQVSPLLWKPIRPGLSAGRVQTVALRLITEREAEIRAFTAEEYWSITAQLEKDGKSFEARLHQIDGKAFRLENEASATNVLNDVANLPFVITELKRRQRLKNPPAPFTTSTLQQEAAKRLGFTAQRTMRTAQQLYEGMDVGAEGAVGLITYMRTDSTRVAGSAAGAARDMVRDSFGEKYLPKSPRLWGGKQQKGSQDAHEAIRPTDATRRPDQLKQYLDRDQLRLYELIWLRFVGGQMAPAVYDTTTADFSLTAASGAKYLFRATGSIMVFDGFTRLYTEAREDGDHRTLDDLDPLPELAEQDRCAVNEIVPAQHFTQPPPRFTEASLVKELERLGIGRPSTYAQIISTITDREYVKLEQKRFQPTPLGETVAAVLIKVFPDLFSVGFTSGMEAELDRIEEGELDWRRVLQDFYGPFQERLAEGKDRSEEIIRDAVSSEAGPCPECGRDMAVRWNRYGRFLGCTGYPECRHTQSLEGEGKAEPKSIGEPCPQCGAELFEREGRFGPFIACSNYPKCKYTRPRTIPGMKCPQCGEGDVGEKRTRRGKPFWGCTRYPDCDWSTWDEPVPRPCLNCDAPFMVRKSTKARGEFLRCLKCAHEYNIGEDGELEPAGVGVPTPAARRSRDAEGGGRRGRTRPSGRAATKSGAKKSAAKKAGAMKPTAKKHPRRRLPRRRRRARRRRPRSPETSKACRTTRAPPRSPRPPRLSMLSSPAAGSPAARPPGSSRARSCRHAGRDAAGPLHARAPDRAPRRAGLHELLQERGHGQRARSAQGRDARPRLHPAGRGRRGARTGRSGTGRGPRRIRARDDRPYRDAPEHHDRARGAHRAAGRARRDRHRPADVGAADA
jgi:DNA topoisomerase I